MKENINSEYIICKRISATSAKIKKIYVNKTRPIMPVCDITNATFQNAISPSIRKLTSDWKYLQTNCVKILKLYSIKLVMQKFFVKILKTQF